MKKLPSVSLVTPCKNRSEYLLRSLPSWLDCPQIERIIIVDFNSSIPVVNDISSFLNERIIVVRAENETLWRQGRAQNIGARLAASDLILKIDSDVAIASILNYIEQMRDDPFLFYKGFSKAGTSSGLCLVSRHQMQAIGGYNDYMSGWGGDDVDFYRRLKKQSLKHRLFDKSDFSEQKQKMSGKNSEAAVLDSEFVKDSKNMAGIPYFSNFRNNILARLQRQTRKSSLRWLYEQDDTIRNLVHARMKSSSKWRIRVAQHNIELANILAIANYERYDTAWDFMATSTFKEIAFKHRLRMSHYCNNKRRRNLSATLISYHHDLRRLAEGLGFDLVVNKP